MTASKQSWIQELRSRLDSPPPVHLTVDDKRRAAVLVPLFVDAGQLWTILTLRADDLPHHRGQVAFPGGQLEAGETPWQAALRESREEIGLESERVLDLGRLDELETTTGFHIMPVVGAMPRPESFVIREAEVAEAFSVPLSALANPQMVEERMVKIEGRERELRIYHVGG
ncbi:MAG TPA: CoA pyrophosphatase, partial [Thermoanaerobaculia bacterium]|nr:CoA pyrophosphatase [Thermoanaerobaculia bacterium]